MTADAPDLGGLSLMLDGYFHEDFRAEYGGHEGAARAFVRDASGEERSESAAALDQLLAWATDVPRARWQEALGAAGGAWRPRSLAPLRGGAGHPGGGQLIGTPPSPIPLDQTP
ncbi:MAG: contact-dependent growth inhibition system immunity protein [Dehalococcoidia bacterium]